MAHLILLLLSALLYAAAFVALDNLWWLSFVCFIPLFYAALTKHLSFKEGFLWGIIALGLHLSGFFYSIFYLADNPSWHLGLLLWVALLYLALHTALWFFFSQVILQFLRIKNTYGILGTWLISTWLYSIYIDRYCLWPFNTTEGLIILNPLLPLVKCPGILSSMSLIGTAGTLFLLLFFQACIARYFYTHKLARTILFLSVLSIFGWSVLQLCCRKQIQKTPTWVSTLAVLPEAFYNPTNIQKTIDQVTQELKKLLALNPQASVVLMPESALFLCDLAAHEKLLTQWNKEHLGKEVTIITGGISYQHTNSYNTAYLIHNGQIKDSFKKRHSMLLTENIASWLNFNFVQSCYYTQRPPITPSANRRALFKINPELALVPYICSELFFNNQPDDNFKNTPIVALCNDSWVIPEYVKTIMYSTAHFRSIQWNRPIVYVAYDHAYYFYKTTQIALVHSGSQRA
ncbi:hypothetical protein H0X48_05355 [Candidatus Dependentiae bacterium]|nr:hypothetical protein [Candidatus Dependentiae bacterium]